MKALLGLLAVLMFFGFCFSDGSPIVLRWAGAVMLLAGLRYGWLEALEE